MEFAGLGTLNALTLGLGLAGGYHVECAVATPPLFPLTGLMPGGVADASAARARIKKFF